jgi:hypothetical protein
MFWCVFTIGEPANMADYYAALTRKIQQARDDPGKMREVVYEAARLALRWQVHEHSSRVSLIESKHHIAELENAIARLEAEAASTDGNGDRETVKPATDLEAAPPSGHVSAEHEGEGEDVAETAAEPHPESQEPAEVVEVEAPAAGPSGRGKYEPGGTASPAAGRLGRNGHGRNGLSEPVQPAVSTADAPEPAGEPLSPGQVRPRGPSLAATRPYLVNPADFVNPDVAHRLPAASRSGGRMTMSGLMIAFQLAVAALAAAAFYVAMWGHNGGTPMMTETPAAPRPLSTLPSPPAGEGTSIAAAPPSTASPSTVLPSAEAPTAAPAAVTSSFPLPTAYGVYAISDGRLIELEQAQATPVDARTGSQLQIIEPGHGIVAPGKPAFVVFRRDLASSAPEKVPLRIAARVAHSMNFDSTGKAVMTTPATGTWIIRDQGYNLRVSPVEGNPEMVLLRPEDPELSLPSGRYELMLGPQAYDLVVAGEVSDPAHCVEGVTTVRGLAFNECKPVL